MTLAFDTSQIKAKFSEFSGRVAHRRERLVVLRRGKPFMALVPLEDLRQLEEMDVRKRESPSDETERHPLMAVYGGWEDSPELDDIMAEIIEARHNDFGREIQPWD